MRSDLPSGTVTFLFTDVEGSTKLLHELGAEAYAEALAEHRRVIRRACAAEGGVEVDTQGDAFFFAFPTAPGALAAASAFTEELASSGPIQVRVGLHTGAPLLTDEGYVGDDVHFAARVAATGHGGQVVLSGAAAERVDADLADLGEHRLKDIPEAVSIFQLGVASFPPLKTISNTNLPRPASSFLGREREVDAVITRIEDGTRLLTLTGPGGTGKTRLAIEAATTLVGSYKAGVFWVGLAALRDSALVTETIAQTLGARGGLAAHIGEREMLVLLDNLEQVVECAPELATLLEACPNLTLLCTSRELLRVRGEFEYSVPPLAEPEAVDLFCERSRLEPTEEIAALCARLDSLPLAVELAASRTRALTPTQILERLSSRLDLLTGGRDADPRQQTLRATIEWSYELLSPGEQQLFARLSVFAGGCTLEAAEEVCDADLDTLQSLAEKSLLRFTASDTGGRYWMLETIREYAGERLVESGRAEELRQRHADLIGKLASRADAAMVGPEQSLWLTALAADEDNIRAALGFLHETGQTQLELELASDLQGFWYLRGYYSEGRRWTEAALGNGDSNSTIARARALNAVAGYAEKLGDPRSTQEYAEAALRLSRELGFARGATEALGALSLAKRLEGDRGASASFLEQAVESAREDGDRASLADLTSGLAFLAMEDGVYDRAIPLAEDARALYTELGDRSGDAYALTICANCLLYTGDTEGALEAFGEALPTLHELGFVAILAGTLGLMGIAIASAGDTATCALLLGAEDILRERASLPRTGAYVAFHRTKIGELRGSMGDEEFEAAFEKGRMMSLADAVSIALGAYETDSAH
ncbi:MAG TPA: adenylate/guanylate cyclase domain-containing protein [Gaiellaceae bacterium]|nr:adenylate/guanylate cyclase domain-containing protein [Gaiellaceae bacterium]